MLRIYMSLINHEEFKNILKEVIQTASQEELTPQNFGEQRWTDILKRKMNILYLLIKS